MPEAPQGEFNGWAVVEIFGHQRHIGLVKTETFGGSVLFRVDSPPLPAREFVVSRAGSYGEHWFSVGAIVRRLEMSAGLVLLGPGSIYRITPCTEAEAIAALEACGQFEGIARPAPQLEAGPGESTELFSDDEGSGAIEARFYSPTASADASI